MLKNIRNHLSTPPARAVIFILLQAYSRTFRLRVVNENQWLDYIDNGGKVLLCTWHQQFFSMIRHFTKYSRYKPVLMTSQSRDGDIIAGMARQGGWFPVRGSSSRGRLRAMKLMIQQLRQSHPAVVIVDGPRGPAGRVKPGVIHMAHAAGAAIVPFYTFADRAWYLNSWDRFMIPKPFSKVRIQFGNLFICKPLGNKDDLHARCNELEREMRRHLMMK